jgi:hypothetical protein
MTAPLRHYKSFKKENNMKNLFKTSGVLWIIWGVVHVFFGAFTVYLVLNKDPSGVVAGIANGVSPELLKMDYPEASNALFGQHGWNLVWFGIVTLIAGFYVWKGNKNAIFIAAMVGGLADLGYFMFMDLGGYVTFFPGTLMTIIALAAILTSFYAHFKLRV